MSNGQKNQLRGYLLGQLPEREQETLEAQFFADGDRLDEVWAAENELVDDFVRERLSSTERQQFEQYYLDSQPHRDRVALARQLLKAIDSTAAQTNEAAHRPSGWANFWALLRGPQLAWGLATAVLLAAFIGGANLLRERAHLRDQPTAQITQSPDRELTEQRPVTQSPTEQVKPGQLPAAPPSTTRQPPQPKVFSFVLSAGLLRGNSAPQPLTIPRGTGQVELRMRLEASDYTRYQIKLRTVEGAEILSRSQLKSRAGHLAVLLPANKLRAGDYILALSGIQAGAVEEVNRYFFRVTQK